MGWSALSRSIGAGIFSLSLALPIVLPAAAQTGTASSNSNTGTSTTSQPNKINSGSANDANLRSSPDSGNSNTATSATSSPNSASTGSNDTSSPSSANTGSSNTSSSSNTTSSPSSTAGNANTSATSSQETTSTNTEHQSDWGLLGLLGLIGLAGLLDRTAPSRSSYASDHLEEGLAQTQAGASRAWDRLVTGVGKSRRRRAREKEIKRIKYALGRPSNRVILDRQDQVILNVGDLITNQAIEQARMANMLDVLLDSVDTKIPEISEEERSAPVAGEASLEKHEQNTNFDSHRQ